MASAVSTLRHHTQAAMQVEWHPTRAGVFASGAEDRWAPVPPPLLLHSEPGAAVSCGECLGLLAAAGVKLTT
jgi:hypothetical protein